MTFGYKFNQPVDVFTTAITHLNFGKEFNKPIEYLPKSITHLTLGWNFNQPIDTLPDSITHLELNVCFDQLIDKFPSSLVYLGFYSKLKINNIPENVHTLKINFFAGSDSDLIDNLPSSVKKIIVSDTKKIHCIKKIPFGCEIVEE